jgi:hypothetical protein
MTPTQAGESFMPIRTARNTPWCRAVLAGLLLSGAASAAPVVYEIDPSEIAPAS